MTAEFDTYRQAEATYTPRPDVLDQLHEKTLVMLVGPTAVGKSTIMNEVVRLDASFARISGFTTREQRPDDEPGLYRYVNDDSDYEMLDKQIENGELVQFATHPTKDVLYGTELSDYPGEFNLKDTLYSAVDNFKQLGFRACIVIGIVTPDTTWRKWIQERFPIEDPQATKDACLRLEEASKSLSWLLRTYGDEEKPKIKWLLNEAGQTELVARRLIDISCGGADHSTGRTYAFNMLSATDDLKRLYTDGNV